MNNGSLRRFRKNQSLRKKDKRKAYSISHQLVITCKMTCRTFFLRKILSVASSFKRCVLSWIMCLDNDNFSLHKYSKSGVVDRMVQFYLVEAVYSNLILFLIFMRMRVVYHCFLASGLLKLVCTFSVPKLSRSETHGLP